MQNTSMNEFTEHNDMSGTFEAMIDRNSEIMQVSKESEESV